MRELHASKRHKIGWSREYENNKSHVHNDLRRDNKEEERRDNGG